MEIPWNIAITDIMGISLLLKWIQMMGIFKITVG